MWRFGLRRVGHFVLGLTVATVLAAAISSLGTSGGETGQAFVIRLFAIAHFEFGTSIVSAAPAWTEVSRRLPVTLELVALGAMIALIVGTTIGVALSDRRAKRIGAPFLQIVSAVPVFCLSLGLLWLSHQFLHWSETARAVSLVSALESGNVDTVSAAFRMVALPALTVGLAGAYAVQDLLRRAVARAANEPYRKGLRALGLGRFEIDWFYFVPQVVATFLMGLGEIAASLFAATAIAERVFDWPGVADLLLKSVALRDWAVAALILFLFASLTITLDFMGAMTARFLANIEAAP